MVEFPIYPDLETKVVLVTGGLGGIGNAVCAAFAANGSKIVASDIMYCGEETDRILRSLSGKSEESITYIQTDITDEEAVKAMFDQIYGSEVFGTVDVLVNSAGITKDDLVLRKGADHLRSVLEVNLVGPYITSREFIRRRLKEKAEFGRIINLGSIIGQVGNRGQAFYSASKGGLHGLTKSLADEVQSYRMPNFTVNAVAPGFIETQMTDDIPEELRRQYIERIPMQRAGKPMEVAMPILFLASEGASYITATILPIDGGWVRYS